MGLFIAFRPVVGGAKHGAVANIRCATIAPCGNMVCVHFFQLIDARVRQAPFQDRIVVIYDLVRLQVCAQHLHRQGQGFRPLKTAYHVKALHLHFFHKVPSGIADTVPVAQGQQAPVEPFVIKPF